MIFSSFSGHYAKLMKAFSIALMLAFSMPISLVEAQNTFVINVRGSQSPTYSRFVYDFPVEVPYRVEKSDTLLSITFDAEFTPSYAGAIEGGQQFAQNYSFTNQDGRTVIYMDVPQDAFPRHFRQGTSVVLDVYERIPANARRAFSERRSSNRRRFTPTITPQQQQPEIQRQAPQPTSQAQSQPTTASNEVSESGQQQISQGADTPIVKKSEAANAADAGAGATPNANTAIPTNPTTDASSKIPTSAIPTNDIAKTPVEEGPPNRAAFENTVRNSAPLKLDLAEEEAKPQAPVKRPTIKSSPKNVKKDDDDVNVNVSAKSRTVDISKSNTRSMLGNETINVEIGSLPDKNGLSLTFVMKQRVPAAAFERSGFLWVVLDKSLGLNSSGFQTGKSLMEGRINSVTATTNRDALVVRMGIRANQNLIMEAKGSNWVLQLKDTPTKPRFPLEPVRRNDRKNGSHVFVAASELGTKLTLEDPIIGDQVIVLPLLGPGRGIVQPRNYTEASLLASAQGIAIEPLSDDVDVERFRNGVAIKSKLLSAGPLDRQGQASRLIDFKAWRIGPSWEFRKNKARILLRLSLADKAEKNQIRWDLARYYLAHGRSGDSLGILKIMLENEPNLEKMGEFIAVRGVANLKSRRLEAAEADLMNPDLNAEQDAELWRAILSEAQSKYKAALNYYRRGKDVMGTYDAKDRADIQLAIIRSAIEEKDYETASTELDLLNGLELSEEQLAKSVYQRGRLLEAQGELDSALTIFDELTDVKYRPISAQARYSRVKHSLARKDVEVNDAIEQLERLRFSWRGDRFESMLISDLADLYLSTDQYEPALTIMRQGISYFPKEAVRQGLPTAMRNTFKELYLEGKANDLPPITAIGLFYKFRELTPKGAEGDRLIRRLADRLVNVDLLDRATELYEYQVTTRTPDGTAKAIIAGRLAKIHILNKKPIKAVEILRATRQQRLPDDVLAERRWVESRALIEQTKYEEAEVLLEDDESSDADALRADLFWGARNWDSVIETNERILANGWETNEPLTTLERLYLIRSSIAMSFIQDSDGLTQMRTRYGGQMRTGDFSNAFELLTNQADLSGGELGAIASQIASVEKLRSFMRDYRSDFNGS